MKYVSTIPALEVNHCFRLPNWLEWMKLFKIDWNCSLLPITFLMSFPKLLRRTIGLKALEKSYDSLLSLEMMIDVDILKCKGQWSNLKYISVMLIIFFRYKLSLTIYSRYLHDNLLGPRVDELLYLVIELINSSSEKETYSIGHLFGISFNMQMLIRQFWDILNDK